MKSISIKGRFRLKPGIRLIPGSEGGVVLRESPLRALRVNRAAFSLLESCADGLCIESERTRQPESHLKATLSVLDRFLQAGLVEWEALSDGYEPFVSIVVAVYNQAEGIGECLESLLALDYPPVNREIIVVDDASNDGTPAIVRQYEVKLLRMEENRGPSAARNAGVAVAKGPIVAFIDSDCIADPAWLRDLTPYFQDSRNALVGGYVDSYYTKSLLDRYEQANSPLCMGRDLAIGYGAESDFYVPTCNMLARKEAFLHAGGLNEKQRVGEDVDLCWKLKELGARLLYVPKGVVKHKHRNQFLKTFRRRFDYGTSEARLHAAHVRTGKRYPWNSASMAILAVCVAALLTREPLLVPIVPGLIIWDTVSKKRWYEKKIRTSLSFHNVLKATLKTHFQLLHLLSFHVVRYYLLPMALLAVIFQTLIPLVAALVFFVSLVEFKVKKAHLNYLEFLFFFITEHSWYQVGAFWGSIRRRSFRNYRLTFVTSRGEKGEPSGEGADVGPATQRGRTLLNPALFGEKGRTAVRSARSVLGRNPG